MMPAASATTMAIKRVFLCIAEGWAAARVTGLELSSLMM
jgi:hypothetical protein